MTMTDPVADLLTRLRNICRLGRFRVAIPHSNLKEQVIDVLKREGFVESVEIKDARIGREIHVTLKYGPEGEQVITHLERVSKPGRRVYKKISDLPPVLSGMGIWILSTSKGILSDNEARAQRVGGEILCKVH